MTAHRNQARDCSPKLNPAGVCNDAPDILLMEAHTGLTGVIIDVKNIHLKIKNIKIHVFYPKIKKT